MPLILFDTNIFIEMLGGCHQASVELNSYPEPAVSVITRRCARESLHVPHENALLDVTSLVKTPAFHVRQHEAVGGRLRRRHGSGRSGPQGRRHPHQWRAQKVPQAAFHNLSELFRQAGLFQYHVRRVPRLDMVIDRERFRCNRAIPYFMVTLTVALEIAATCQKNPLQARCESVHQWV